MDIPLQLANNQPRNMFHSSSKFNFSDLWTTINHLRKGSPRGFLLNHQPHQATISSAPDHLHGLRGIDNDAERAQFLGRRNGGSLCAAMGRGGESHQLMVL